MGAAYRPSSTTTRRRQAGTTGASYGDADLAAAVALHQISNPWATSLSGKVLSMTGVTLPASMSSPKTSRFCSLSAPVGQLECPEQPGGLHAAIATDGTPRAVNCRSARGRSWHSRIAAMESGCLSLLTICTVHITYADRKETVQRTLRAGLGRPARRGWVLKPSISSSFVRFAAEL